MQKNRIFAALLAALMAFGATYPYAMPLQKRNNAVFWRAADAMRYAYNAYGQPVAQYHCPAVGAPPNYILLATYDRYGNRTRLRQFLQDGSPAADLRWTYDRAGRMLTQTQGAEDGQSVTAYTYELDGQGRVVQIREALEGETLNVIRKSYRDTPDGGWRESAVRYAGPGLLDTWLPVDPLSLLGADEACMRFGQSETVYDAHGAVQQITVPDGGRERAWRYTYDEQGRAVQVSETQDGRLVLRTAIDYGGDGLIAQLTSYDAAGQMQSCLSYRPAAPFSP